MMMNLLAVILQPSAGIGSSYACVVAGAGTSAVNGNYLAENKFNENGQYYIGEVIGYYGDSYIIFPAGNGDHVYYYWPVSQGFNPTTVSVGPHGSSPAPTIHS